MPLLEPHVPSVVMLPVDVAVLELVLEVVAVDEPLEVVVDVQVGLFAFCASKAFLIAA